eukprot:46764-Rhodomonas_salina.1
MGKDNDNKVASAGAFRSPPLLSTAVSLVRFCRLMRARWRPCCPLRKQSAAFGCAAGISGGSAAVYGGIAARYRWAADVSWAGGRGAARGREEQQEVRGYCD